MIIKLAKIIITLILLIALIAFIAILKEATLIEPAYAGYIKYVYAVIILTGGIIVSRQLATLVVRILKDKLGTQALIIGNSVIIIGYIISITAAISYIGSIPEALLAGATFSGLIIGLAAQPVLSNFFSGILMLVTGMIKPGSQVRILTWHIPFQWAFLPGYKYFSPDSIYAGYMGNVLEIGLFYTKVLTEEGQIIKIPNTILATDSGVVEYNTNQDYIFNVRYEFPVKCDPEIVLARVKNALKDMPVLSIRINEQSDKDYYIVKIIMNAKGHDHADLKSEALKRLIKIHKELKETNSC